MATYSILQKTVAKISEAFIKLDANKSDNWVLADYY